jgi:hypothetical protein
MGEHWSMADQLMDNIWLWGVLGVRMVPNVLG